LKFVLVVRFAFDDGRFAHLLLVDRLGPFVLLFFYLEGRQI
jgi:hypothetical protein